MRIMIKIDFLNTCLNSFEDILTALPVGKQKRGFSMSTNIYFFKEQKQF